MSKLRIWLDDERSKPPDYDMHLKHADDVIELIKQNKVAFVSLDNDLGTGYPEGRTVAEFIEREYLQGHIDFVDFRAHTANNVAFDAMMACKRAIFKHRDSLTTKL